MRFWSKRLVCVAYFLSQCVPIFSASSFMVEGDPSNGALKVTPPDTRGEFYEINQGVATYNAPQFAGITITGNGEVRMQDGGTSGYYVGLKSPALLAASYSLAFPGTRGSLGDVLLSLGDGTTQWFQSPAQAHEMYAYLSAPQMIVSSTPTPVVFNTVVYDDNESYDPDNGIYQAPNTGRYRVNIQLAVDAQVRGNKSVIVYKKQAAGAWEPVTGASSTIHLPVTVNSGGSYEVRPLFLTALLDLTAGDKIACYYCGVDIESGYNYDYLDAGGSFLDISEIANTALYIETAQILKEAVSTNTPDTLVLRDGSGSFSAEGVTASSVATGGLTATGETVLSGILYANGGIEASTTRGTDTLNIGTTASTHTINVGSGSSVSEINVGTGSGTTTINLGGSGDTVYIAGTLNCVTRNDMNVADKLITLNNGGAAESADGAGVQIQEDGSNVAYIKTSSPDRGSWLLKAPATDGVVTITPGESGFTINQGVSSTSSPSFVGLTLTGLTSSGVVHNSDAGIVTSGQIVNADVASYAAIEGSKLADASIADSKLQAIATAGKVANSATTATDANTGSAIVARDAYGNFAAETITVTGIDSVDTGTKLIIGGTNAAAAGITMSGDTTVEPGKKIALKGALSGALSLQAAAITTATQTLIMPDTDGQANTFLKNDGTGVLTWDTSTGGVTQVTSGDSNISVANQDTTPVVTLSSTPSVTSLVTGNIDASSGALSIGTSTAGSVSIGKAGVTTTVAGPLTLAGISGAASAGVVHNNASGQLSSSQIIDADVALNAAISGSKLAAGTVPNTALAYDSVTMSAGSGISLSSSSIALGESTTISLVENPSVTSLTTGSVDASSGVLGIGTSTADSVSIGKSGVATTVAGPLTLSGITGATTAGILQNSSSGVISSTTSPSVTGLTIDSLSGVLVATSGSVSAVANGSSNQVLTMSSGTPTWTDASSLKIGSLTGVMMVASGTISATTSPSVTALTTSSVDASSGALSIGTSTAGSVGIGKAGVTTTVAGPLTLSGISGATSAGILQNSASGVISSTTSPSVTALTTGSVDASSGALGIGTSTAGSVSIGKAGVTTTVAGSLTLSGISGATTAGVLHNNTSGQVSSSQIVDADVASNAAINGSKLATGTVANAALTNSSVTINAGSGISVSSSSVALGGSTTISLASNPSVTSLTTGSIANGSNTLSIGATGATAAILGNATVAGSFDVGGSSGAGNLSVTAAGNTTIKGTLTLSGISGYSTAGLLKNDSSGTITSLANGVAGTILVGGSIPSWSSTPTLTSLLLSGDAGVDVSVSDGTLYVGAANATTIAMGSAMRPTTIYVGQTTDDTVTIKGTLHTGTLTVNGVDVPAPTRSMRSTSDPLTLGTTYATEIDMGPLGRAIPIYVGQNVGDQIIIAGTLYANGSKGIDSTNPTLNIAGTNCSTQTVNLGIGEDVTTINIGNGLADANRTVINVNGILTVPGGINHIVQNDHFVTDQIFTVNKDNYSYNGCGIGVYHGGDYAYGYILTDYSGGTTWQLKAPGNSGIVTIDPGFSGFTINQGVATTSTPTFAGLNLTGMTGLLHASVGSVSSVANGTADQILTISSGGVPAWSSVANLSSLTLGSLNGVLTASSGSVSALSNGSSNQILTISPSGVPAWSSAANVSSLTLGSSSGVLLADAGSVTALANSGTGTVLIGGSSPSWTNSPSITGTATLGGLRVTGLSAGVLKSDANGTISYNTITNHAVQVGNSSGGLTQVNPVVNGVLVSTGTGVDPSFSTTPTVTNVTTTGNATVNGYVTGSSTLPLVIQQTGSKWQSACFTSTTDTTDVSVIAGVVNGKAIIGAHNKAMTGWAPLHLQTSGVSNLNAATYIDGPLVVGEGIKFSALATDGLLQVTGSNGTLSSTVTPSITSLTTGSIDATSTLNIGTGTSTINIGKVGGTTMMYGNRMVMTDGSNKIEVNNNLGGFGGFVWMKDFANDVVEVNNGMVILYNSAGSHLTLQGNSCFISGNIDSYTSGQSLNIGGSNAPFVNVTVPLRATSGIATGTSGSGSSMTIWGTNIDLENVGTTLSIGAGNASNVSIGRNNTTLGGSTTIRGNTTTITSGAATNPATIRLNGSTITIAGTVDGGVSNGYGNQLYLGALGTTYSIDLQTLYNYSGPNGGTYINIGTAVQGPGDANTSHINIGASGGGHATITTITGNVLLASQVTNGLLRVTGSNGAVSSLANGAAGTILIGGSSPAWSSSPSITGTITVGAVNTSSLDNNAVAALNIGATNASLVNIGRADSTSTVNITGNLKVVKGSGGSGGGLTIGAITTNGLLQTTGSNGTVSSLTTGAAGTVLVGGSSPTWSSTPAVGSITIGQFTSLGGHTASLQNDHMWDGAINIGTDADGYDAYTSSINLGKVFTPGYGSHFTTVSLNGKYINLGNAGSSVNICSLTGILTASSGTVSAVATGAAGTILIGGSSPTWSSNPTVSGTLTAGGFCSGTLDTNNASALSIGASNANAVNIGRSSAPVKISNAYTLPTSIGSNGQFLTSDGNGGVAWKSASAGNYGCSVYMDKNMKGGWNGGRIYFNRSFYNDSHYFSDTYTVPVDGSYLLFAKLNIYNYGTWYSTRTINMYPAVNGVSEAGMTQSLTTLYNLSASGIFDFICIIRASKDQTINMMWDGNDNDLVYADKSYLRIHYLGPK